MIRHGPNTVEELGRSRAINSYGLTKPLTLSSGLVSSELFPLHLLLTKRLESQGEFLDSCL